MQLLFFHLDCCYALFQEGLLTEKQAQKRALESIRNFTYGNDDYVYIYDRNMLNLHILIRIFSGRT